MSTKQFAVTTTVMVAFACSLHPASSSSVVAKDWKVEDDGGGGEGEEMNTDGEEGEQLNNDDGNSYFTVGFFVFVFVGASLICLLLGLCFICKKAEYLDSSDPGYSVAVSNRLFKEMDVEKDLPCLNCRLIEMGEMACYQDTCPQCGNIPPCRKHLYETRYVEASASSSSRPRVQYNTVVSKSKSSNLGRNHRPGMPQNRLAMASRREAV